jgi:hypothetical protein
MIIAHTAHPDPTTTPVMIVSYTALGTGVRRTDQGTFAAAADAHQAARRAHYPYGYRVFPVTAQPREYV